MNVKSLFDLEGRTALVTGCNRGIGKAIAIGLAEAGADIVGVSQSIALEGSDTEKLINHQDRKFTAYQADLADRESLYEFISIIKSNHRIDILVNNAGIVLRKPVAEHDDQSWDQVMAINLDTPFILARELGKEMIGRGYGKIIFTCSLLSFQGGIKIPGYAASKGALNSLVKSFANEWASKGVNVNGIAPGYIATDNTRALRDDSARNKAILERIPAGRWGNPEDCAGPVVFLASDASTYVHGTLLTVDGGWMGR